MIMIFKKIRTQLRRRWDIQMTIVELNHLDNKELDDLNISRWQISNIAAKNARS